MIVHAANDTLQEDKDRKISTKNDTSEYQEN